MEDIKNLLKKNEDYSMIYSDGSDSDNESLTGMDLQKYSNNVLIFETFNTEMAENSLTSKKRNTKERLPTRRPDPNVYNRNALLARENRRKKKIYLETIEKELQLARKANRVLLKALKRQLKIGRRLEEEKMYFKRLVAKRSDHSDLDQAIKSPTSSDTETNKSFSISGSFENLNYLNSEDGCEMRSCSNNILGGKTGSLCIDSASDDFENEVSCLQTTSLNWDDVWSNNGTNVDYFKQNSKVLQDVNNDHCYVTSLSDLNMTEENDRNYVSLEVSEMCLHHANGDFLEAFCPTCSITPGCRTPPIQLLDDMV